MKKSIIIFVCIFCFCSCENLADSGIFIQISNRTNMPVHFIFSRIYPDTSLPEKQDDARYAPPMGEGRFEFRGLNYIKLFESLPADTLTVFAISTDTIAKYGWNQVRSGNKILKRYDISKDALDRNKNTITYP